MKKASIAVFSLLLCSMLLVISVGTVMAYETGYEITEWWSGAITADGKWTTPEEWQIGEPIHFGTTQKGLFVMQLDSSIYAPQFLVEFADSTPDAGDIIQVCINGGVDSVGPTNQDFKIEIQGLSTQKVYVGTGSAWTDAATASAVTTAATITTSAHDPANHVVAEFIIDKAGLSPDWGGNPPPENVRIACYDASTDNWVAWPPESSADNPSTWGQNNNYSSEPYPEGLTVGVMLLASSVALVVAARYFRKPQKL